MARQWSLAQRLQQRPEILARRSPMKSLKPRHASTGGAHAEPKVRALAELIRDEYLEMADMALTVEQACLLWGAHRAALVPALHELVDEGVLRLSNGRYVLAR